MKIEDVEKAVSLKEKINLLTYEVNQLQKRKTFSGGFDIYDEGTDKNIYVPEDVQEDVLDTIISAKNKQLEEYKKQMEEL